MNASRARTWVSFFVAVGLLAGTAAANDGSRLCDSPESGPSLVRAVSSKEHFAWGYFDLDLPLDGPEHAGVEHRRARSAPHEDQKVILTFSEPVRAADGSLDPGDEVTLDCTSPGGEIVALSIDGADLTVDLRDLPDQACCRIAVKTGVRGLTSLSGVPLAGDNDVHLRVLLGDVTGDGVVDVSDFTEIKRWRFSPLTDDCFRADVNRDGCIDVEDLTVIKVHRFATASCVPTEPPTVTSFAINNGASDTLSRTVTLDNTCIGLPTEYMASESADFAGAAWEAHCGAPSFTLSAGDGTKTVYFKVRNGVSESAVASDTIVLAEPPSMVLIPAGEFQMGDTFNEGGSDERTVHAVYVDAFYMDRYEVTNQQYAEALNWAQSQGNLITVVGGMVYKYDTGTSYSYCDTTTSSSYSRITWDGSTFGVVAGKENHPMVRVSWYGSVAYANWRSAMEGRPLCYDLSTWTCNWNGGYRLPTEAEWEKAARGGAAGHRFPWTDQDTIQHARANYYSDANDSYDTSPTRGYHPLWGVKDWPYTSPVGFFDGSLRYKADFNWPGSATSYQTADGANGCGLYDMAGNVREWCNDWYSSSYYSSSPYDNPRGPTSGTDRVRRGGCWNTNGLAFSCRVARRLYNSPVNRGHNAGFRLALGSP